MRLLYTLWKSKPDTQRIMTTAKGGRKSEQNEKGKIKNENFKTSGVKDVKFELIF